MTALGKQDRINNMRLAPAICMMHRKNDQESKNDKQQLDMGEMNEIANKISGSAIRLDEKQEGINDINMKNNGITINNHMCMIANDL